MVGLSVALAATAGYEAAGGYAIPVDADVPPRGRDAQAGPRGGIRLPGHPAGEPSAAGGLGGLAGDARRPGGARHARRPLRPEGRATSSRPSTSTPIYDADGLVLNVGKLPAEAVTRLSVLRGGSRADDRRDAEQVRGARQEDRHRAPIRHGAVCGWSIPRRWPTSEGHFRGGTSFADDAVIVIEVAEGSPAWEAGPAARDVDHAGRRPAGPHAQGVCRGRGRQPRPRATSSGRRGKAVAPHGGPGNVERLGLGRRGRKIPAVWWLWRTPVGSCPFAAWPLAVPVSAGRMAGLPSAEPRTTCPTPLSDPAPAGLADRFAARCR